MIGRFLEISIQTEEILASVRFLEALGFRQLSVGETWTHPYAVLSDGRVHIGLHAYSFDSPALSFVLPGLAARLPGLADRGVRFVFSKTGDDEFHEAGFLAPGEQMIALLEARTYSPPSFADTDFSLLGRFCEYSLPTRDVERATAYWEGLGLLVAARYDEPHPHVVLRNDDIDIGLHETRTLRRPALSFIADQATVQALETADFNVRASAFNPTGERCLTLRTPDGLELNVRPPGCGAELLGR